MSQKPTSEHLRRRNHVRDSRFKRLFGRVCNSRREKRKLFELAIIAVVVLIAFVIGFYLFGPSFSSSGGE